MDVKTGSIAKGYAKLKSDNMITLQNVIIGNSNVDRIDNFNMTKVNYKCYTFAQI